MSCRSVANTTARVHTIIPYRAAPPPTTAPSASRAPSAALRRAVADSAGMTDGHPDAPVLLDLSDGVATITFNRPDAMNSLDIATKELLLETVTQVADDPAARCVVLTGTGRAFCTGQDLKEHIQLLESGGSDQLFTTVDQHYNPIVTTLAGMEKPVIAAVNGVAAGAGASLAFACDLRDHGRHRRLQPRLRQRRPLLRHRRVATTCRCSSVGPRRWSCSTSPAPSRPTRPSSSASRPRRARRRARRGGRTLATRLAAGPTVALGAMRRSVSYAAGVTFTEALELESAMMTKTGATADHRAAVAAFVAKEKPVFEGR